MLYPRPKNGLSNNGTLSQFNNKTKKNRPAFIYKNLNSWRHKAIHLWCVFDT